IVLPSHLKPLVYNITVEPIFELNSFTGNVSIDLNPLQKNINAHSTTNPNDALNNDSQIPISIDLNCLQSDPKNQTITFNFAKNTKIINLFNSSNYLSLSIHFSGKLNNALFSGFCSGQFKKFAISDLEPSGCRSIFPCFDQPNSKAIFNVSLIADMNLTCLSNMDIKSQLPLRNNNKKKIVSFNPSPLMSTYILAFLVADLKCYEYLDNTFPIRVYTLSTFNSNYKKSFNSICQLTAKTLEFLSKTFHYDYNLPHLNYALIPGYNGAMENWGLIVATESLINENILLPHFSPDNDHNNNNSTSLSSLDLSPSSMAAVQILQHELSHQWFGNLVTMHWWNSLWLNEGFATFLKWYIAHKFYPSWKVWPEYIAESLELVFKIDSSPQSHPVELNIQNVFEANDFFDPIVYIKGCSLLLMIFHLLGENHFNRIISLYLKTYQFKNLSSLEFWNFVSKHSNLNITNLMYKWTFESGYPIIMVSENQNQITLNQQRCFGNIENFKQEKNILYPCILRLKNNQNKIQNTIFDTEELKINFNDASFFKINSDHIGIYRTCYEKNRWEILGKQAVITNLLSVEDRIGLITDSFFLGNSGYCSIINFFNLIKKWTHEEETIVWLQMLTKLHEIRTRWTFESDKVFKGINKFISFLISFKLSKIDLSNLFIEINHFSNNYLNLEKEIIHAAIYARHLEVLKRAVKLFRDLSPNEILAMKFSIKISFYQSVAFGGNENDYEKMIEIYEISSTLEDKKALLSCLGGFSFSNLIDRTLNLILDSSFVEDDQILNLVYGFRYNKMGKLALWNWFKEN
ncbi:M1 family metallopeptidase, partial [Ascoidea rubescens DSM 1968]